ncbi:MAG: peptide chain release factor N(5)-glutamine methyltransferase [Pseudolabrys sp.]
MRTVAGLKAGVSVDEAQRLLSKSFALAGIESGMTDARALIGAALRLSRAQLLAQSDRLLEPREIAAIDALATRRMKREPVSRILGRKEFWSLLLDVTPDVLVPRPDTETLVEAALDYVVRGGLRLEPLRILDIGTGTGALVLALLQELPKARGVATDVSAAALSVARGNAERLKLASRCAFLACNLADGVQGRFDLIVSNPPYIARGAIPSLDPEVRDYDPKLALDGGADGLDAYRAIAASVPPLLAPGGRLIVELGIGQSAPVTALFEAAKFTILSIRNDLGGIPRALVAKFERTGQP